MRRISNAFLRSWLGLAHRVLNAAVVVGISVFLSLFFLLVGPAEAGCFQGRCANPGVSVTAPAAGASFLATQSVTITGRATGDTILDSTGEQYFWGISRVDIYRDGVVVGTATLGASGYDPVTDIPWRDYSYTISPMAAGSHTVGAQAVDTGARSSTVVTRSITVAANVNPSVSISAPATNTVSTAPGSLTFTATASDSDGTVSNVQWFANGSAISGALTAAPYSFTWSGVAAGTYTITARATDNAAGVTTSAGITVISNDPPTVSLSPSGASNVAPGAVTLQSTVSNSVGSVSSVQYFANGGAISGALTSAPYAFTWSGVGAGSYSVIARATDSYGATGDSSAYAFPVNAPPSIGVTAPSNGAVLLAPASVTLSVNASDTDGSIAAVQYYLNGSALGSPVTNAPFSYTWNTPAAGTYSVTARATDNGGAATTSAAVNFTINDRPSVSLNTSGANGQAPGSITLQASASDTQGGISSVQYFANGSAISSALTSAPYTFNWTSVGAGNYSVIARATDAYGATNDSSTFAWSVNQAPSVTLTSPSNGAVVNTGVPAAIALAVSASDGDGSVTKVEYFANGSIVATATSAPFSATWNASSPGSYSVQARATDNAGGVANSSVAVITVDAIPTAAITSPANGASFQPGLDIPISVSAADSDGSITKVEVYNGSSLLGTVLSPPYNVVLADAPTGTYVLTAKAYDNQGAVATSAAVTVNVGFSAPPASSSSGYPGKLLGNLTVTPTGSAQYVVPIALPPGSAGMVPSVALKYESGGGNGIAGTGWSLTGLSQISRCSRDRTRDGIKSGVELTSSDQFCLDGQRLILIDGIHADPNSEYRTEIDTFSKIIALGTRGNGPESFVVVRRDGTRLEYGNTSDSRAMLPSSTPPASTTPIAWSVNRVGDPRGNYYTIQYSTTSGQQVPVRIDYTGNTPSALTAYNSIQFIYDTTRPDVETHYVVGEKVTSSLRLSNIRTFAGNKQSPSSELVKDYRIAYGTGAATGRSRVLSITECGDLGPGCLPPTVFSWDDTPNGTFSQSVSYAGGPTEFGFADQWEMAGDGQSHWIDVNGDGRPDHCYMVSIQEPMGSGGLIQDKTFCSLTQPGAAPPVGAYVMNASPLSSYFLTDVGGDGVADLCSGRGCLGDQGFSHFPWDDTNEEHYPDPKVLAREFVDYDGSGKAGVCTVTNGGSGTGYRMECGAVTPSSLPKATTINYGAVASPCIGGLCEPLQFAWPDITGDGIPSFCRIVSGEIRCRKLLPTGFGPEITSGVINLGDKGGRSWVDVNGDGKADFCRVVSSTPNQSNVSGTAQCTLSTGKGFGDTLVSAPLDVGVSPPVYQNPNTGMYYRTYGRAWVDVNGDGKADYCRAVGSALSCVLSTGSGFGPSFAVQGPTPDRMEVVDVSGDGRVDFCDSVQGATTCRVAAGAAPDVLLAVADGLGATTAIQYRPISDGGVYTKGTGASFPTIDLQDSTQVVSRTLASNGVGGSIETAYRYEGAKAHRQGRGFQGYSAVTATGPTGVAARVETNTSFPFTGMRSRSMTTSGGTTLSDASFTYVSTLPYGTSSLGVNRVYPDLKVTRTYDLNGAFINWVEVGACGATYSGTLFSSWISPINCATTRYDQFGNALVSDTVFRASGGAPDGYSQTAETVYLNDQTNWILGRPTSLTTTSRIPGKPSSVRTMTSAYFTANPGLGLLMQNVAEPNDTSSLKLVTGYTYDAFGNVRDKKVSGPNIAQRTQATYTYDEEGRFATQTANALGHTEVKTFDKKFGGALTSKDPNLLVTSWTYDIFGRKRTEDRPDGTRTTLTYNVCIACVTGAAYSVSTDETVIASGAVAGPPSRIYYDTLGRSILSARSGFGGQFVYNETLYDALGRVGFASAKYFASDNVVRWTQYDYDALGRVTTATAPDNSVLTSQYNGRETSAINQAGVKSSRVADSQGRVTTVRDAVGTSDESTVTYEYDHWGDLTKTTDSLGNVVSLEYDLRGRKTRMVDPDLGTWQYTVDNLGLTRTQTDAKGQVTTFTYDLLDRLSLRSEPGLTSNWYFETNASGVSCMAPTSFGKLCESTTDNLGYRRTTYDTFGRLWKQTLHIDVDYNAEWLYNAAGRLDTKTFPASTGVAPFASPLSIKFNYTSNGYLQSLANSATGSLYWTRNSENAEGNLTGETYGNGLTGTRGYDPVMGRLITVQAGPAGIPSSVQNLGYHYDNVGRVDQRQDLVAGVDETFGYDNLGRMTKAVIAAAGVGTQTTTVAYNAIGNILNKSGLGTYAYNPSGAASVRPHAVAGLTGTINGVVDPNYAYDANGNMLTDGTRSFSWTSFNMPSTLTKVPQAGSPGAGVSTFLYGPEHQRLKQTWVESTKTLTTYYVDEPQFEKEVNSQTGIAEYKHYISAEGRIVAIHTRRSDGTEDAKYLLPDHLGSTIVVTDAATGSPIERLAYDPWGDRRVASGGSVGAADPTNSIQPASTDRGYTGHEHLDQGNMGLVHMNGRVYDPTLGRFISADPTVPDPYASQSLGRYTYVRNSPMNATDPTGLAEETKDSNSVKAGLLTDHLLGAETVYCYSCQDFSSGGNASKSDAMTTPGTAKEATGAGTGTGFNSAPTDSGAAKSEGGGSWLSNLGERFKNLALGGMFKTDAQMDTWGANLQAAQHLGPEAVAEFARRGDVPGMWMKEAAGLGVGGSASVLSGAAARHAEVKVALSATEVSVEGKLYHYVLNTQHAVGGSKAQWFEKALGFNKSNMDGLAKQIVFDPKTAVQTAVTQYGTKFNQTISITGANGRVIDVTFAWIRNNDNIYRLVTAIPGK